MSTKLNAEMFLPRKCSACVYHVPSPFEGYTCITPLRKEPFCTCPIDLKGRKNCAAMLRSGEKEPTFYIKKGEVKDEVKTDN